MLPRRLVALGSARYFTGEAALGTASVPYAPPAGSPFVPAREAVLNTNSQERCRPNSVAPERCATVIKLDSRICSLLLVGAMTSAAPAQEVCSGPTAWICEEHQMFNAAPPAEEKFKGSTPPELLRISPEGPPQQFRRDEGPSQEDQADEPKSFPDHLDKSTIAQERCRSRREVQGGWPKYRIINGRQCWYSSTPPRTRADSSAGHESRQPSGQCQDQAGKLDSEAKRTLIQECISAKR